MAVSGRLGVDLAGKLLRTQAAKHLPRLVIQARNKLLKPPLMPCTTNRSFARPIHSAAQHLSSAAPDAERLPATPTEHQTRPAWEIRMLYDGDCPLCMREVNMLRRRDEGKGKIDFVDVASPDYDPADNAGISYKQAMGTIHALLPDGRVVTNIEVFRRLYEAVGLGWVYAITKYEPVAKAADAVYGVWAKYRLPITGRSDLDVIMRQKETCRKEA
ncbi:hypothetical protein WJX72_011884 [[Myrmecia] bisecta]|uniref:Thiol-disulfide oxidoreductase DCC n=1 Tax=[Myrmecia] bisecta TaxID=41462 RepID=A0AAW1PLN1_9CHLO